MAYSSRKLNDAERKYAPHEGELLGLIHALKTWRHYLLGNHVDAYTDHHTLQHFQTQPHISGRRARWIETLQEFDVTIHYLQGQKNIVADCLSRRPHPTGSTLSVLNLNIGDSLIEAQKKVQEWADIFEQLCHPSSTIQLLSPKPGNIH